MTECLAYIPFLHPISFFHDWWYVLIVPLSFGISVIYKALRLPHFEQYWRHVAVMTIQIVVTMIALALGLALMVQYVVPLLPVR